MCRLCITVFTQMCDPPEAFSCSLHGSLFCMLGLNSMSYHSLHLRYCNGVDVTMILFPLSLLRVLTCPCQVSSLSANEKMGLPFISGSSTSSQPSTPSPFISEGTHASHLKACIDRYPRSYFSGPTNSLLLLSPLYTSMEPDFKSRNLSLFPSPTLLGSESLSLHTMLSIVPLKLTSSP